MLDTINNLSEIGTAKVIIALLIVLSSFPLIRAADKLLSRYLEGKSDKLSDTACDRIRACAASAIIIIMLVVLLALIGTKSSPAIIVFAIITILFSYASKNNIQDISAGIVLKTVKIIHTGNYVNASGFRGVVKKIGFSFTTIRADDGTSVYVPNHTVASSIVNVTEDTTPRLVSLKIPVSKDADPDTVSAVLAGAADGIPHMIEGKTVYVGVSGFNEYNSDPIYECRLWCESRHGKNIGLEFSKRAMLALKEADIPMSSARQ